MGQIMGQIITGRAQVGEKIGDMTIEHEASTVSCTQNGDGPNGA